MSNINVDNNTLFIDSIRGAVSPATVNLSVTPEINFPPLLAPENIIMISGMVLILNMMTLVTAEIMMMITVIKIIVITHSFEHSLPYWVTVGRGEQKSESHHWPRLLLSYNASIISNTINSIIINSIIIKIIFIPWTIYINTTTITIIIIKLTFTATITIKLTFTTTITIKLTTLWHQK